MQQHVPHHEIEESWKLLEHRLPKQTRYVKVSVPYPFIFAGLILIIGVSTLGIAQAATPNQPLYQLKVASDNVVANILQKPQLPVEQRTTDVIQAAKQSPQQLKPAISAYQKTLQQTAQQAQTGNTTQKNSYKQDLTQQENKLKNIQTTNEEEKTLIDNAITQTEKTKGEVKAASTVNENEVHNLKEHNATGNSGQGSNSQKGD